MEEDTDPVKRIVDVYLTDSHIKQLKLAVNNAKPGQFLRIEERQNTGTRYRVVDSDGGR